MSCKVISLCNQKGGVSKTVTTLNLGYALAEQGHKVLILDFDPQSNLSMCLGEDQPDQLQSTIYHLMMDVIEENELVNPDSTILHKGKLDLLPSSIELSAVEVNLVNAMSREVILKAIVDRFRDQYEYILIDCPPALGMLTINALAASDEIILTVTPQFLSAKGLELLLRTIIRVKKRINPQLEIAGILITMYTQRTLLSREILQLIQNAYEGNIRIFETKIPVSVKVGEANLRGMSIIEYQPENSVSKAYIELAKEFVSYE